MSEANLFRQYAKKAMRGSSKATSEDEKWGLMDLACTWVQAALASERVFGSGIILPKPDAGEATPPTLS